MNFLKKIFSPTALMISLLLLIYVFYRSEIYYDGYKREYYFDYYLIALSLTFFSIITFFINQTIKEYLIISGISLVLGIYLFEGYLTLKGVISEEQLSKEQLYEKQTGNKWDRRKTYEIYSDLKKKDNQIVMAVIPRIYLSENKAIFSLAGVSNAKTLMCNENGYYSMFQSDRYGFRNPDNEWDKKENEYLIVGDSFAFGSCVNKPNDIASNLRSLSNKSVLNLGYAGNGPLIQYATLREYLNPNVKKVLFFYFEANDFRCLLEEKDNKILINYLNDLNFSQNLKSKQNKINELAIEEIERRIKSYKLRRFVTLINTRTNIRKPSLTSTPPPQPTPPLPEFKKILELTKELTMKNNSKLYFIYLPEYYRYKTKYNNTNYNLVKDTVNKLNIPFIDIHKEVFEKEQNPLKLFPFESAGHYNIKGYKKVAETIYQFTKD